jgi:DNA-directed RNA polymerase specialized sigma24 family protein
MLSVLMQRKLVRKRVATLRERLFRTAYAWCHNRALADDLVQETSLKALGTSARPMPGCSPFSRIVTGATCAVPAATRKSTTPTMK